MTFLHVLMVVQGESALISNTIFVRDHYRPTSISLRNMGPKHRTNNILQIKIIKYEIIKYGTQNLETQYLLWILFILSLR